MKTIRWFFGVALVTGATALSLLTDDASAGDVVVKSNTGNVVLSAGQKTTLRSFVTSIWPGVTEAEVDGLTCQKTSLNGPSRTVCSAYCTSTLTAQEYADAEDGGTIIGTPADANDIAVDGTSITTRILVGKKRLTDAEETTLFANAETVFGGSVVAAVVQGVYLYIGDDGELHGSADYLETLTPVARLQCLRDSSCGTLVGVVE